MIVEFLKNLLWVLAGLGLFAAFVAGLALVTIWSSRNRRVGNILFAALILALAVAVAAAFTWGDMKQDPSCAQAVEATP